MTLEDGSWNLDLFRVWLSEDVIQAIKGIPPPHCSKGPDRIAWSHTSSGAFTVKSAYKVLNEGAWNSKDEKWKIVWKYPGPQRIRIFLWIVLQGRFLSNVERVRRGLSDDPSCHICGHISEDVLYILHDCPAVRDVWAKVNPAQKKWSKGLLVGRFNVSPYLKLIILSVSIISLRHIPLRNEFFSTLTEQFIWTLDSLQQGVLRDKLGNWIAGFHRFLGKCSVFDAEL